MHAKLPLALAMALTVVVFAVLPSAAMGEQVTMRSGGESAETGMSFTEFSTNFKVEAGELTIECDESEFSGEVTENPGARVELTSSRIEGGGTMSVEGAQLCSVGSLGGRIEAGVSWTQTTPQHFRGVGEEVYGESEGELEIELWDRTLSPSAPFRTCLYSTTSTSKVVGKSKTVTEIDTLIKGDKTCAKTVKTESRYDLKANGADATFM